MKHLLMIVGLFVLVALVATPTLAQGKVTLDVPQVQAGTWQATGSNLSAGTGDRQMTVAVSFPKPFKVKPEVVVGLTMIDAASGANTRVNIVADGVSRDGFTVVVKTWADSKVNGVQGSWVATATSSVTVKVKE